MCIVLSVRCYKLGVNELLGLLSLLGLSGLLGPSEIAFAFHGINYLSLLSYQVIGESV